MDDRVWPHAADTWRQHVDDRVWPHAADTWRQHVDDRVWPHAADTWRQHVDDRVWLRAANIDRHCAADTVQPGCLDLYTVNSVSRYCIFIMFVYTVCTYSMHLQYALISLVDLYIL